MNQKVDILILVKTYPEYSKRYTETVCTAGIRADTGEMIRIYPLRYRYLGGDLRFKKFQWIRAEITKANQDPRPESFNPTESTIELGEVIGTEDEWHERAKWVINSKTCFSSVENLYQSQKMHKTSLGVIKPKDILKFSIEPKTAQEIQEAESKKRSILSEGWLFDEPKDLEFIPYRFSLEFKCDNPDCNKHKMSILDWEIGQLYRKVKQNEDWKEKIEEKIWALCGKERESYLILGNMARWQNIFCILGFFYPPRRRQLRLF